MSLAKLVVDSKAAKYVDRKLMKRLPDPVSCRFFPSAIGRFFLWCEVFDEADQGTCGRRISDLRLQFPCCSDYVRIPAIAPMNSFRILLEAFGLGKD